MAPQPNATPWWLWVALGAIAAAAVCSFCAALWLRLPQPLPRHANEGEVVLQNPPSLPGSMVPQQNLGFNLATELPPATELPSPTLPELQPSLTVALPPVSATTAYPRGQGRIVLVIDDMGMEAALSTRAVGNLPSPVTFAFLVEGTATATLAAQAKAEGHPIILHLPMEPQPHPEGTPPLGAYGLNVGMTSATIAQQLEKNLALLPMAEGVNNHMGSRFTQWSEGMAVVLADLESRNLYFLDSRTAAPTATREAAAGLKLGRADRDVFLDHTATEAAIRAELLRAVKLAQKRKTPVVVIGHPLPATLTVLEADLPAVVDAGIQLMPLRAAVK